jgi:NADP-dependent 3-hydroxy acid dehydrogenase YdfG
MAKTVVVLGARNLGGAIIDHFLELGWNAAGVARSDDTLARVRERGALALAADASDPRSLAGALAAAREQSGSLDAVVNAVTASRPTGGPFGGGELAAADLEAFRGWTVAVAEQAFVFLSVGSAALRESGGGALVQITGGSSRRAIPGRGLWAAGAFATRALVQAAAQEMRGEGIHVALLAVDATIESPKTEAFTRDTARDALADMSEVARAVSFLVEQRARAYTHELTVTPAGERWVP